MSYNKHTYLPNTFGYLTGMISVCVLSALSSALLQGSVGKKGDVTNAAHQLGFIKYLSIEYLNLLDCLATVTQS